jgi:hypothetical protein
MFNGGLVAWGSWKQDYITRSTIEVKYFSAHVITNEITWMCKLLGDLGYE